MLNKKKLVVSDASTLILLIKAGLIKECEKLFEITIPGKVYEEVVVAGKRKQREDAFIAEKEIRNKNIEIVASKHNKDVENLAKEFNLGTGETESLCLYFQAEADLLLTDDKQAMKASNILNVNWTGAPNILLLLFALKLIGYDKALESLAKLQKHGRYKLDHILETESKLKQLRRKT